MKCQRRFAREMLTLSWSVAVILLAGCTKDDTATGPSPIPSVAGLWRGNLVSDYGPTRPQRLSTATVEVTQIGYELGGVSRHINWDQDETLYYFKGRITTSCVLSVEETSFVPVNWSAGGARTELLTWEGRLCADGDSIYLTSVLGPHELYPIRLLSLAKH